MVEPTDLYVAFDTVLYDKRHTGIGNELTVDEFMSNWTTQAGYPVLNIEKNETTHHFSIIQVINRI